MTNKPASLVTEREVRPYWYPTLCDGAYCARLREDYPDDAHMSDEELCEEYNDGLKYSITWDHAGDAYDEYEPLADAFLELAESLAFMVANIGQPDSLETHHGFVKARELLTRIGA